MTEKAGNFDWVTALSECSVAQVFEVLRLQVKSDIETREALRPQTHRHYAFKFVSNGRTFAALVEGHKVHRVVRFGLEAQSITVRDDKETVVFTATTTLNDDGDCRLKINGQERELWQVRKMALEGLLFGGAEWDI
jgi:hypothetical protein